MGHPLARSRGRYSDRPNTQQTLCRCANYTTAKADALKDASSGATADQADKRERRSICSPPALPRSLRAVSVSGLGSQPQINLGRHGAS